MSNASAAEQLILKIGKMLSEQRQILEQVVQQETEAGNYCTIEDLLTWLRIGDTNNVDWAADWEAIGDKLNDELTLCREYYETRSSCLVYTKLQHESET